MKTTKYLISACFCGLLAATFVSCAVEDPTEYELYKKQIYLVGAADIMQTKDVDFSGDGSLYVSAAISGSQYADHDVSLTLATASNAAVKAYNRQNVVEGDVLYQVLPTEWYTFPDQTGTIKAGDVYTRIPIKVSLDKLKPDSLYVIPLRITHVSDYETVDKDSVLLVHVNQVNSYSGAYMFNGKTMKMVDGQPDYESASQVTTLRNAKAMNSNTIRLFQKVVLEKIGNVADNTYNITINEDNSLTVKAYKNMPIIDGGGTYDPKTKSFDYWYTYKDGNTIYRVEATLTPPEQKE